MTRGDHGEADTSKGGGGARTDNHPMVYRPRVCEEAWKSAYDSAVEANEPVFVPTSHYCDDRGWSLMNLMTGVLGAAGQINFSIQYPGVIKAWHRHDHQTDFWCCLLGHLKVGVYRESDDTRWSLVMGEKRPGILIIPPPLWHGAATVGPTQAGLLYYVTKAYNPQSPDEHRRSWDSVAGFPWEVELR